MKIIKDEINSDDPDRRLKAAIAVMELNNKQHEKIYTNLYKKTFPHKSLGAH